VDAWIPDGNQFDCSAIDHWNIRGAESTNRSIDALGAFVHATSEDMSI